MPWHSQGLTVHFVSTLMPGDAATFMFKHAADDFSPFSFSPWRKKFLYLRTCSIRTGSKFQLYLSNMLLIEKREMASHHKHGNKTKPCMKSTVSLVVNIT